MSRPLRIEYPGAWYQVMNRGAARADIFDTPEDWQMFLVLLSDIARRFAIETHGYCLMSNHYHLLLHTPRAGLARGMRHLNGLYTQYLKRIKGVKSTHYSDLVYTRPMSRPLRIEYPGAWYHVMNRGAARADIFDTPEDWQMFLVLLSDIARRFAIETHGYCLMSNHYHLLLHTPRAGLARGMRHLNGLYTQYLNRKRSTDGPLFRGRYKSIVVEDDVYLLQVSRYIHLNPVGPGLVDDPADYAGSSCRDYTHKRAGFAGLETAYLLDMMGGRNTSTQRRRYRQFLSEGVDEATRAFYANQRQSPIFGSDAFRDEILADRPEDPEVSELRALRPKLSLAAIQAFVAQHRFSSNTLSPRQKRDVAFYLAQREGYRLKEIAAGFGMNHYTSVSSAIRRLDTAEPAVAELLAAFSAEGVRIAQVATS